MSDADRHMAEAVRNWLTEAGLTHQQAADLVVTSKASITNWAGGDAVSRANLPRLLNAMGVATVEEAEARYVGAGERTAFFSDFSNQSQGAFLAAFKKRPSEICETRIATPAYPPFDMKYRSDLNEAAYSIIKKCVKKVRKVEEISNYYRLIDILVNIEEFGKSKYEVRTFANARWMPRLNLTIFGRDCVIVGGFHREGSPTGEPFLKFSGHRHAEFFHFYFERVWGAADSFSLSPNLYDTAAELARCIPHFEGVTPDQLKGDVQKRREQIADYAPRY